MSKLKQRGKFNGINYSGIDTKDLLNLLNTEIIKQDLLTTYDNIIAFVYIQLFFIKITLLVTCVGIADLLYMFYLN